MPAAEDSDGRDATHVHSSPHHGHPPLPPSRLSFAYQNMALTGTVCLTVGLWPCGSCGEKTGMAKHAHACLPVNGRTDGLSKDESKRAPFRCDFTNHFTSAINTARETGKRSECGRPAKEQVLHGGERWVGRSVGRSVGRCAVAVVSVLQREL